MTRRSTALRMKWSSLLVLRHRQGRLAQLEERHVHTVEVGGSRPPSPTPEISRRAHRPQVRALLHLLGERQRVEAVECLPKGAHCAGANVDHLDECRKLGEAGHEVESVVQTVVGVEVAERGVERAETTARIAVRVRCADRDGTRFESAWFRSRRCGKRRCSTVGPRCRTTARSERC